MAKVITHEDGGCQGGDDGKFMGLVAVCKADSGMGNVGRLEVGAFGHDEVGSGGGKVWDLGLLGNVEGRGEISTPESSMAVKGCPFNVMGMQGRPPLGRGSEMSKMGKWMMVVSEGKSPVPVSHVLWVVVWGVEHGKTEGLMFLGECG